MKIFSVFYTIGKRDIAEAKICKAMGFGEGKPTKSYSRLREVKIAGKKAWIMPKHPTVKVSSDDELEYKSTWEKRGNV